MVLGCAAICGTMGSAGACTGGGMLLYLYLGLGSKMRAVKCAAVDYTDLLAWHATTRRSSMHSRSDRLS
jgi:hypothetical protein